MFASNASTNRTSSQRNDLVMPPPTGLPWNISMMPWGMQSPPSLVEFTAAQNSQQDVKAHAFNIPTKRKLEFNECFLPKKLSKTDEVMAAHLNGLHISSEFTSHGGTPVEAGPIEEDYSEAFKNRLRPDMPNASIADLVKQGDRIVLCDEMRKLKNESLLPHSLIEKLEKPCMSLVLWQPPDRNAISQLNSKVANSKHRSTKSSRERAGLLVQNYAEMEMDM